MRSLLASAAFALALASVCLAQQGAPLPHFDVISIQPIPRPRVRHPAAAAKAVFPGGRYYDAFATFYDLFVFAYPDHAADQTVTGFPAWGYTRGDYFSVEAKATPNTSPSLTQMQLMMQSLLASRFGLKFHIEHRVMPVYFLEVAKAGIRDMKPSAPGELYEYPATLLAIEFYGATARAVTMQDLASRLAAGVNRPAVDRTRLTGRYDIDVPRPASIPTPGSPQESFLTALRAKLGLKLVAGKAAVPVMVIDQIHRPTPN